LTKEEIEKEMRIINEGFKNQLKTNSINRHDKASSKMKLLQSYTNTNFTEWFNGNANKLLDRSSKSYLDDVDKFIESLIEISGIKTLEEMSKIAEEPNEYFDY
jgi:hypothetical protein